jgi:uncharacterized membrane protein YhaH (DUF805 family)
MNFGQAIQAGFRNYVVFQGRASRSEYWYWFLFVTLVRIVLSAMTGGSNVSLNDLNHNPGAAFAGLGGAALSALWNLAVFLPTLGVTIRRFRDAGYSPKLLFWSLAPAVLALIALFVLVAEWFNGPTFNPNVGTDWLRLLPGFGVLLLSGAASLGIGIWFLVILTKPSLPAEPAHYDSATGVTA